MPIFNSNFYRGKTSNIHIHCHLFKKAYGCSQKEHHSRAIWLGFIERRKKHRGKEREEAHQRHHFRWSFIFCLIHPLITNYVLNAFLSFRHFLHFFSFPPWILNLHYKSKHSISHTICKILDSYLIPEVQVRKGS